MWELTGGRNSFPYLIESVEDLIVAVQFFFITAATCLILDGRSHRRHIMWLFRLLRNAAIIGFRRSRAFQLSWSLPDSDHLCRVVVRGISHGIYIKAQQVNKACQYYWGKSLLNDPLLLTSSSIYIHLLLPFKKLQLSMGTLNIELTPKSEVASCLFSILAIGNWMRPLVVLFPPTTGEDDSVLFLLF